MKEKIKNIREKYLPYDEVTLRRLALTTTFMFSWILVWALVFKLGSELLLVRNYTNLKDMTLEERILWDLIPFNYSPFRGTFENMLMDTVLNCFVLAPLGVVLCYLFKNVNVWRNAAICLAFSVTVELLQLITTLGNPATEDLITNVAGCFIGFVIYQILFKRLSIKRNVQFFAVANLLLFLVTIYSLITTVNAMDIIIKILTKTL